MTPPQICRRDVERRRYIRHAADAADATTLPYATPRLDTATRMILRYAGRRGRQLGAARTWQCKRRTLRHMAFMILCRRYALAMRMIVDAAACYDYASHATPPPSMRFERR